MVILQQSDFLCKSYEKASVYSEKKLISMRSQVTKFFQSYAIYHFMIYSFYTNSGNIYFNILLYSTKVK